MAVCCPVCDKPLGDPLYRSTHGSSLDSLGRVLPFETRVHHCPTCNHVATEPIPDLERYYADNYRISLGSDEEDQLYEIVGDKKIFRTDHQAKLLTELVDWHPGMKVLDYGCAKASTFRKALTDLPAIELSLFDVSHDYRMFWDSFVPQERQAVDVLPIEWESRFDLVTSFFSLEHIANPRHALQEIASLLTNDGHLYLVVPDMFANPGDFVVLDHVNHFTRASLARLITDAGLSISWVRSDVHRGALVALASSGNKIQDPVLDSGEDHDVHVLSNWWNRIVGRILARERESNSLSGIYGAGFYGSFIFACLENPGRVQCFLDNNPFLHNRLHLGLPVLRPMACPPAVKDLWIGLNPLHARRIMDDVDLGDASPRELHLAEET